MSEDLTDNEQREVRLAKRERLLAEGEAYPVDVFVTHSIPDVRAEWGHLQADETTGTTVSIAGRVVFARNTGKLCFATLQSGDGSRIQVMISLAEVGEESLERWKELVDLGDIVQVEGEVISSKRGELSVLAGTWMIAAKALLPLPNLYEGTELSDETRVRQRYLDLITREQARINVRSRASINASIRQTLTGHGFLEIETPMLQTMHGGASARPFITHSNDLDMDLYLRIAPELYLKRAVVGGIERVFEINRNFRNEGVDATHNPEFAMLEAYQAYGDYNTIGELTREMVQNAAVAVGGSHVVTLVDGSTFDFGGEWPSISMYDSLSQAIGTEVTPQTPLDELARLADQAGVEVKIPTHGKYIEELWEHHVSASILDRPTFVRDFPVDTSPLVRDHRSIEGVVEKWDLYVRGFELATGYSELVDPVIQRQRFIDQAKLGARGDVEAMRLDEDFLRAMEHGMPPMGGMGMGIDRLMVALTGLGGLRETVLFPLVK
jgi:lysyl-tRNA synthetase class 2